MGKYPYHTMAFHSISGLLLDARYPHQLSLPQWLWSPPISTFQKCKLTLQNSTYIHTYIYICAYIHITDLAAIHNHRKRARPRSLCLQNGGSSVWQTVSHVHLVKCCSEILICYIQTPRPKKDKKKNNHPSLKACQEPTNMVPQK